MIDALLLMTLAAFAFIGWLKGMLQKRAQFWVKFCAPIGLGYLAWYFFFVLVPNTEPAIMAGNLHTGWYPLACMVGGVWAFLAKPTPERPAGGQNNGGATPA